MADGKLLQGQQFDPSRGTTQRFTERVHDYDRSGLTGLEGNPATEQIPMDGAAARVRVYSALDSGDLNDALMVTWSDYIQVQFPDVLTALTSNFNTTTAGGDYDETGNGRSAGNPVNLSMSLQATGQASVTIVPDLIPTFAPQIWSTDVKCTQVIFYMDVGNTGDTALLAALTAIMGASVLLWPAFRPKTYVFLMHGKQMDLQTRANVQESVGMGNTVINWSYSQGSGGSYSTGGTVKALTIGPVLNGAITISNPTHTETIVAASHAEIDGDGSVANLPLNGGTDATTWADLEATGTLESEDIIASITPTSISATSITAIPTSGLKVKSVSMSHFVAGVVEVHAIVVDFAQFA